MPNFGRELSNLLALSTGLRPDHPPSRPRPLGLNVAQRLRPGHLPPPSMLLLLPAPLVIMCNSPQVHTTSRPASHSARRVTSSLSEWEPTKRFSSLEVP